MCQKKYVLIGKIPVEVEDLVEWAKNFEFTNDEHSRVVAKTEIDKVLISTVFLGLCHQFSDSDKCKCILFETMIFDNRIGKDKIESFSDFQYRYESWESAEFGHKKAVEMVKKELGLV